MNSQLLRATPTAGAAPARTFVIARRCGRLANRLVLFSNAIAYAIEHGGRVLNPTFHSYAQHFQLLKGNLLCSYPAQTSLASYIPFAMPTIRRLRIAPHATRAISRIASNFGGVTLTDDDRCNDLNSSTFQDGIDAASVVFLDGWEFRSESLVERHAPTIREYFRPIKRHQESVRQSLARLRQTCDVVVGVHVRYGDYRGWLGGKYYFPPQQYKQWMDQCQQLLPNRRVGFLVCTNERSTCEPLAGPNVEFGPGNATADLFSLAACDYLIGPHSTYTQWASFYGQSPMLHMSNASDNVESLDQFEVSNLDLLQP